MEHRDLWRVVVSFCFAAGILGDSDGQLAIITRTNFTLFTEAVKKCCYSDQNIRVAFAGVRTCHKFVSGRSTMCGLFMSL